MRLHFTARATSDARTQVQFSEYLVLVEAFKKMGKREEDDGCTYACMVVRECEIL
jgi:hypothetical protein